MSKPRSVDTLKVQFIATFPAMKMLKTLLATGLYGHTVSEVARRLVDEGLQRRFANQGQP